MTPYSTGRLEFEPAAKHQDISQDGREHEP
nr:MAG TPA: hypothetical protein [Caudoviricetes sp.]